jgi:hypothetical protein
MISCVEPPGLRSVIQQRRKSCRRRLQDTIKRFQNTSRKRRIITRKLPNIMRLDARNSGAPRSHRDGTYDSCEGPCRRGSEGPCRRTRSHRAAPRFLRGAGADCLASFRINLPRLRGRLSQSVAPSIKVRRPSSVKVRRPSDLHIDREIQRQAAAEEAPVLITFRLRFSAFSPRAQVLCHPQVAVSIFD